MVTIFMPFAMADLDTARELESELLNKGHQPRLGAGTDIVGEWRPKLIRWLKESDVVLPLLSDAGYASNYVASEIGMARAFSQAQDMLVLPVVMGETFRLEVFIQDYHCLHYEPNDREGLPALATRIDDAIQQWGSETPTSPRIFISHRHAERAVAKQLVSLLEAAFEIQKGDLRCTSVHPYTLNAGVRTSDKLRSEISHAEVVVGLISPVAADSKYVLAELGAAWGRAIPTFPLRVKDAAFEHIPEPLNERHSLDLRNAEDCAQLVDDLADATSLTRRASTITLDAELKALRAASENNVNSKRSTD